MKKIILSVFVLVSLNVFAIEFSGEIGIFPATMKAKVQETLSAPGYQDKVTDLGTEEFSKGQMLSIKGNINLWKDTDQQLYDAVIALQSGYMIYSSDEDVTNFTSIPLGVLINFMFAKESEIKPVFTFGIGGHYDMLDKDMGFGDNLIGFDLQAGGGIKTKKMLVELMYMFHSNYKEIESFDGVSLVDSYGNRVTGSAKYGTRLNTDGIGLSLRYFF